MRRRLCKRVAWRLLDWARMTLTLFTPGPVEIPAIVTQHLLDPPCNYHRQDEFKEMFAVMEDRAAGRGYASAAEIRRRDELYRTIMQRIVETSQRAGARVALVGVVQNFADWAPGASTHRADLDPADLTVWNAELERGARIVLIHQVPQRSGVAHEGQGGVAVLRDGL